MNFISQVSIIFDNFFNEPQRAQRALRKRMERSEDVKKWLKFVRCEIFY